MRAIKGRDTSPELVVRKWLYSQGYRFRCQYKKVPGKPDIAIPKLKTLIEIRGCFWHRHKGCPDATTPKSNLAFWKNKFKMNVARDARHEREWADLGWNLIVIWSCDLKTDKSREKTFRFVKRTLERWARDAEKTRRGDPDRLRPELDYNLVASVPEIRAAAEPEARWKN